MFDNIITFKIACNECKNLRHSTLNIIVTEKELISPSKADLVALCDDFEDIVCEMCGKQGQSWTVFKIELAGEKRITKQAIIQLRVLGTKLSAWIEDENGDKGFSQSEMDTVFSEIDEVIRMKKSESETVEMNLDKEGTAVIIVDFINDYPFAEVSLFKLHNLSYSKLNDVLDFMESNC